MMVYVKRPTQGYSLVFALLLSFVESDHLIALFSEWIVSQHLVSVQSHQPTSRTTTQLYVQGTCHNRDIILQDRGCDREDYYMNATIEKVDKTHI